jgi:hypothetical protein
MTPFLAFDLAAEKVDFSWGASVNFNTSPFLWLQCFFSVIPHIYSYEKMLVTIPVTTQFTFRLGDDNGVWINLLAGIQNYHAIEENFIVFYGLEDNIIEYGFQGFE